MKYRTRIVVALVVGLALLGVAVGPQASAKARDKLPKLSQRVNSFLWHTLAQLSRRVSQVEEEQGSLGESFELLDSDLDQLVAGLCGDSPGDCIRVCPCFLRKELEALEEEEGVTTCARSVQFFFNDRQEPIPGTIGVGAPYPPPETSPFVLGRYQADCPDCGGLCVSPEGQTSSISSLEGKRCAQLIEQVLGPCVQISPNLPGGGGE